MSHGWIKLYRSLRTHWLFDDAEMLRVWIELLLQASHKDHARLFNGELIELARGSLVLSKLELAGRLGLSRPRLDRILKKLERDRMIVQQSTRRHTGITILNYREHQTPEVNDRATAVTSTDPSGRASSEQPATDRSTTAVQPACTNNKENKENTGQKRRDAHPLAEHFLPIAEGAEWMRSQQYVCAGRRPLCRYPLIFLTPDELSDVFEQLGSAGIPADEFKLVFKRVAARLATAQAQGKDPASFSAYNWLIGWAKEEVVRELTASSNLERSRVYLLGARR